MIYGISSVNLPGISNVRSSSGIKDPGYYYVNGEKVYYEKPAGYIFGAETKFASHGSQTAFLELYPDGKFPWVEGTSSTAKPTQTHHFLTNKSSTYTAQIEKITKKYGLDLDGSWNKAAMQHQGRHPNAYHDYMLNEIKRIDSIAKGDTNKFLKLFESVKNEVLKNPDMLTKSFWE
jgi:hypothetical protein